MVVVSRAILNNKRCVEDCRQYDIFSMAREVDLTKPQSVSCNWRRRGRVISTIDVQVLPDRNCLKFSYCFPDRKPEDRGMIRYFVGLDTTKCYFGGHRYWFLCPNCNRRCAKLYLPTGQTYFACRICYNLTYRSQQEKPSIRHRRYIDSIMAKAGIPPRRRCK